MADDSTLLRVRTAWKENDFVTVDSLMTDLEENIANNQWREIPDSIINIWIRSLYREANYEKCISLCKESLIDNPLNWSVKLFIARCHAGLEDIINANITYKELIQLDSTKSEPYIMLMRFHYKEKEYKEALYHIGKILELEQNNKSALIFKARIHSLTLGINESLDSYMELYEKYPSDVETNCRIGQKMYELERFEESKFFLLNTLSLDPEYRPARRLIGLCLNRLGETSDALGYLYSEADREPEIISNWQKIIDLFLKMNQENKVYEIIERAVNSLEDELQAYVTGYTLSRSILWEEGASKYYKKLNNKFNHDFNAHHKIYDIAMDIGDMTLANYSLKGMEMAKINLNIEEFNSSKEKYSSILYTTQTSEEEMDESLKNGNKIYISELAIRRICQISCKERRRKPIRDKHKIIHITSSLGRGGAERQLVIGVIGIKNSKKVSEVSVMTHRPQSEKGTYAEILKKNKVEIIHYGNSLEWSEEFNGPNLDKYKDLIKLLPLGFQRDLVPLTKAFMIKKPTIIHAWQDQTNIVAGIAGLIARVPIIVMFGRSMRPDGKTMLHIRNRPYLKSAYLNLLKHNNISLHINSNAGKKSYSEWLDLDLNKLNVMHNGIDFDIMKTNHENEEINNFCKEFNVIDYEYVIGGVFRFVREKRLELWVNTAKRTIDKREDVIFIAVGDGPESEKVKNLIKNTKYEKRILFPGISENVSSWLEIFDLFLLTSIIEGLPNVLIEAQSFGIPVISTPAGGSADTFVNYSSGLLIKEENAESITQSIILLLDDYSWRDRASTVAKEYSKSQFSKEIYINNLIKMYDLISNESYEHWYNTEANILIRTVHALIR